MGAYIMAAKAEAWPLFAADHIIMQPPTLPDDGR